MKLSNKHNYSVTSNVNICYYFADMAISFKYWVQAVQCNGGVMAFSACHRV